MKAWGRVAWVWMLAGCAAGPEYKGPPDDEPPAKFKNAGAGEWKAAAPADNKPRGDWWAVFHDSQLDGYVKMALANNQDLRVAAARIGESRALARVAAADFYPQVIANPSGIRTRTTNTGPIQKGALVGKSPLGAAGAGSGAATGATGAAGAGMTSAASSGSSANSVLAEQPLSTTYSLIRTPLDLNWEIDLFGRVRRSYQAARAEAQSVQADYQNMALSVAANVIIDYFALRALDAEVGILQTTINDRREALRIATERLQAGLTSELDAARASADLASNQADLQALLRTRGEMENALATLVGRPASTLKLGSHPLTMHESPPRIPPGLPSRLLERRPDVASAERQLAAANARIGVAKAAFFPIIKLTGEAGFESVDIAQLFNWESRIWTIGANAMQPVFEGGRNVANLNAAKARNDEAIGTYRGQVIKAFQEVEDALIDLRTLAAQAEAQGRAVEAARRAHQLSEEQYKRGAIAFLDVLDTQRTVLADERQSAQILGQRLQATVRLIKALGGDWHG